MSYHMEQQDKIIIERIQLLEKRFQGPIHIEQKRQENELSQNNSKQQPQPNFLQLCSQIKEDQKNQEIKIEKQLNSQSFGQHSSNELNLNKNFNFNPNSFQGISAQIFNNNNINNSALIQNQSYGKANQLNNKVNVNSNNKKRIPLKNSGTVVQSKILRKISEDNNSVGSHTSKSSLNNNNINFFQNSNFKDASKNQKKIDSYFTITGVSKSQNKNNNKNHQFLLENKENKPNNLNHFQDTTFHIQEPSPNNSNLSFMNLNTESINHQNVLISSLKTQLSDKENTLKEKENYISRIETQLKSQEDQQKQLQQNFKNFQYTVRDLVATQKLQLENCIRLERQRQIREQKDRLGEKIQQRTGTRFEDIWLDGNELKSIKYRIEKLNQNKEELQKKYKQLKSNKSNKLKSLNNNNLQIISLEQSAHNNVTSFFNEDSNSNNDMNIVDAKQRLEYQIFVIEKEMADLIDQESILKHKRILLDQQMKLDYEERNCRYGKCDLSLSQQWPRIGEDYIYQLLALLGRGGESEVYKAYDLAQLRECAIKIHQLSPNWSETCKSNYIKHATREFKVHAELNHPNIVKFYDTFEIDTNSFGTVLEYCEGPDLHIFLKKQKNINEKEAKVLIRQILSGLRYMHNYKTRVIHYDLKPQNIMFHKGELKISDFGLCKIIEDENLTKIELTNQGAGTYWYLPPECFQSSDIKISPKVDVWSLGVIFYEMLFGERPFGHGMSQDRIMKEKIILNATSINFPQKPVISKECQDFIKACLQYDQNQRIDINDAYNSIYMQKK